MPRYNPLKLYKREARNLAEHRNRSRVGTYRRIAFSILALALVLTLIFFRGILLPFVIGGLMVFILEPLVRRLARLRVPRSIAVLIVLGGLMFTIVGFTWALVPRLQTEFRKVTKKFELLMTKSRDYYEKWITSAARWIESSTGIDGDGDPRRRTKPLEWGLGPDLYRFPSDSTMTVPYLDEQRLPIDEEEIRQLQALVQITDRTMRTKSRGELEKELARHNLVVVRIDSKHYGIQLRDQSFQFAPMGDDRYVFTPQTGRYKGKKINNFRKEVEKSLWTGLERIASKVVGGLAGFAEGLITGLMGALIGFVLTFMVATFMLMDFDGIAKYLDALVPDRWFADYSDLKHRLNSGLGGAVRGQLMIALIDGVLCGIGFAIFVPEYTIVLAILSGALALIPVFGTIITLIPAVLIGLSYSPMTAVWVLTWISGVHLLDANILSPKIIGASVKINPVVIIFVLIAGQHAFGAVGALLAVPTTAILQAVIGFVWTKIRPPGERNQLHAT